ncbi:hypothetical protein J6590_017054 [Homalodisca vitripennis]|nr:hypothetical protein J6590_017054 [Homalodisca vitripennis]
MNVKSYERVENTLDTESAIVEVISCLDGGSQLQTCFASRLAESSVPIYSCLPALVQPEQSQLTVYQLLDEVQPRVNLLNDIPHVPRISGGHWEIFQTSEPYSFMSVQVYRLIKWNPHG